MIDLDDDGYPTEESLAQVKSLNSKDAESFLVNTLPTLDLPYLVVTKSLVPSKHFRNKSLIIIEFHTQGWSGNEDLIAAMEANPFLSMRLSKWERGGHWTYEVPA